VKIGGKNVFPSLSKGHQVGVFENLFLQLSLGGEEWLVLVDGGEKENKLDDSNTFERMEINMNSFGSLKS